MIGIVLVGHGDFAPALKSSVEMIAGEQEKMAGVSLDLHDSTEDLERKIKAAIDELGDVSGILFLTDLVGGTPFKASALLSREWKRVCVVGGVNLAMVLEVLPGRDHQTLEQVKDKAMRAGREGIQGFP
ncbi:MAG: PTS sugar transporter subunit IIA [Planifilum sp.]